MAVRERRAEGNKPSRTPQRPRKSQNESLCFTRKGHSCGGRIAPSPSFLIDSDEWAASLTSCATARARGVRHAGEKTASLADSHPDAVGTRSPKRLRSA